MDLPTPFQRTTDAGVNPLPFTVSENELAPGGMLEGEIEVMAGAGFASTLKSTAFDGLAPVLKTSTGTVPAAGGISLSQMVAEMFVLLPYVVYSSFPFQRTFDAAVNPVPDTFNENVGDPQ